MSPPSLAARLASAPPRTRALLLVAAAAGALLLAAVDDPLLSTAARAALVAIALAGLAWWTRRAPDDACPGLIQITERRSLSRDATVALLRVRGRMLLVGHGPDGVRLLADLGVAEEETTP